MVKLTVKDFKFIKTVFDSNINLKIIKCMEDIDIIDRMVQ